MRALKKIMAALALTAVLAGCSADNILSSIQGGKAGTVQTVSRPAVESAELQFTHPDRKSTRLNSSHSRKSRMPSSA